VLGFETSVFNLFRVRARDLDVSRSRSVSALIKLRRATKESCYLSCGGVILERSGCVFIGFRSGYSISSLKTGGGEMRVVLVYVGGSGGQ
jgi:hypothetical protein